MGEVDALSAARAPTKASWSHCPRSLPDCSDYDPSEPPSRSPHTPFSATHRNTEDDAVLRTHKLVYSQLLRATGTRAAGLSERVGLLVRLLDLQARGTQ